MPVATLKRSFLSRQQLSKVQLKSVIVGDSEIKPISSARNLWAWFDTKNLSMSIHVSKACKMVYFPSDRFGSIYRKMLPKSWYTSCDISAVISTTATPCSMAFQNTNMIACSGFYTQLHTLSACYSSSVTSHYSPL